MNEEYQRKTDKEIHELNKAVEEIKRTHTVDNAEIARFQSTVTHVLYGDKEKGEIGMKQQNDEMYKLLTQGSGLLGFLKIVIILGGALGVIKIWLITK